MKILLMVIMVLFAGAAQAFEIIGVDSVNVTAAYTEPTTNADPELSPLVDLDHVTVYYDLGFGDGPQIGVEVPASSPTGGMGMTAILPVPVADGQEADVTFFARAFDRDKLDGSPGNASADSSTDVLRVDRLAPSAPL
jgi:hypothetical protein